MVKAGAAGQRLLCLLSQFSRLGLSTLSAMVEAGAAGQRLLCLLTQLRRLGLNAAVTVLYCTASCIRSPDREGKGYVLLQVNSRGEEGVRCCIRSSGGEGRRHVLHQVIRQGEAGGTGGKCCISREGKG